MEMYARFPAGSYPDTKLIRAGCSWDELMAQVSKLGLSYPFCVKPDVGMKGLMFRIVRSEEQLRLYHDLMTADYLIQALVDLPVECSVFYSRLPAAATGLISGLVEKEPLHLIGTGTHTVGELIQQDVRARMHRAELMAKHAPRMGYLLPRGERLVLTDAANAARGARMIDRATQVTPELLRVFDVLYATSGLGYGRFDLKCASLEDLQLGKFLILEFNGCGAEPIHMYAAGWSWWRCLREVLRHNRIMFRIARANCKSGTRPWPYREGKRFLRQAQGHMATLKALDSRLPF
jgi:hypothetical protein